MNLPSPRSALRSSFPMLMVMLSLGMSGGSSRLLAGGLIDNGDGTFTEIPFPDRVIRRNTPPDTHSSPRSNGEPSSFFSQGPLFQGRGRPNIGLSGQPIEQFSGSQPDGTWFDRSDAPLLRGPRQGRTPTSSAPGPSQAPPSAAANFFSELANQSKIHAAAGMHLDRGEPLSTLQISPSQISDDSPLRPGVAAWLANDMLRTDPSGAIEALGLQKEMTPGRQQIGFINNNFFQAGQVVNQATANSQFDQQRVGQFYDHSGLQTFENGQSGYRVNAAQLYADEQGNLQRLTNAANHVQMTQLDVIQDGAQYYVNGAGGEGTPQRFDSAFEAIRHQQVGQAPPAGGLPLEDSGEQATTAEATRIRLD